MWIEADEEDMMASDRPPPRDGDNTLDLDQVRAEQAFGQALAAGDRDVAIQTLLAHRQRMVRTGHSGVLVEWLTRLPGDALLGRGDLTLTLGQACAHVGDTVTATAVLRSLRESIDRTGGRVPRSVLVGIAHLEANVRLLTGDLARIRQPLLEIRDVTGFDESDGGAGGIDRSSVTATLALGHLLAGDLDDAIGTAEQLLVLDNIVPPTRAVVSALGTRALAHAWADDEDDARRAVRDGMPVVTRFRGDGAEPVYLHLAALWIAEDGGARESEAFATERAHVIGSPYLRLAVALAVAHASIRAGQARRADDALTTADEALGDLIDPAFLGMLHRRVVENRQSIAPSPTPKLTAPEIACLEGIARGLTRPAVAEELSYTVNTVKTHLRHAYRKLGAIDRDDAIAKATARGLLAEPD